MNNLVSSEINIELTLRDIAKALAGTARSTRSRALEHEPILAFLRDGDLAAHIHFPSTIVPRIDIPCAYWTAVSSERFKQIGRNSSNPQRRGTFYVTVKECFKFYLRNLNLLDLTSASATPARLIADAMQVADSLDEEREVLVFERDWSELRAKLDNDEPRRLRSTGSTESGPKGRPPCDWEPIRAFLFAEFESNGKPRNYKNLAARASESAKAKGFSHLPEISTIKGAILKFWGAWNRLEKSR